MASESQKKQTRIRELVISRLTGKEKLSTKIVDLDALTQRAINIILKIDDVETVEDFLTWRRSHTLRELTQMKGAGTWSVYEVICFEKLMLQNKTIKEGLPKEKAYWERTTQRANLLKNLKELYKFFMSNSNEFTLCSQREINQKFGIPNHVISYMIREELMSFQRAGHYGLKREYVWLGPAPSKELVNDIYVSLLAYKRAQRKKLSKEKAIKVQQDAERASKGLVLSDSDILLVGDAFISTIQKLKQDTSHLLTKQSFDTKEPDAFNTNIKVLDHLNKLQKRLETKISVLADTENLPR